MSVPTLDTEEVSNQSLMDREYKGISAPGLTTDEAQGIVECFVSGIGNKDNVGDIVMPGAFDHSLHHIRNPRVVWGHDWNHPVGKVLEIYEVEPGDKRLPEKMRRAGIGGLYAKVQFNLTSERGREAFSFVQFYGEDQEWSIGYKTRKHSYDAERKANLLHEVELYEVSPVLHGANGLTGTVSIKDASAEAEDEKGAIAVAVNPAGGARSLLARAIAQAVGQPVQIIESTGSRVVYADGSGRTYAIPFRFDGSEFRFQKPYPVAPETTYRRIETPVTEPDKDCCDSCAAGGTCDSEVPTNPGSGMTMKGDDEARKFMEFLDSSSNGVAFADEVEEKVGRMISGSNLAKLREALGVIQSMIDAAAPRPDVVEEAGMEDEMDDPDEEVLEEEAVEKSLVQNGPDKSDEVTPEVKVPQITGYVIDIDAGNTKGAAMVRWALQEKNAMVVTNWQRRSGMGQIFLTTDADEKTTLKSIADALAILDFQPQVTPRKLDFYGDGPRDLAEAFVVDQ